MSQMSQCIQPTMYKFFYFKIAIKTRVDSYMPCEAMAHSTKFLFLECNRSHVRTIASQMFLFYFWSAILRTYERLQAKFYFISGVQSFARTNDCKSNFYFISGVQSFARTNDCKSNVFILFLECNRSYVRTIASQMLLFYFWSAIVRTYERLQAKFYFISGVQSFARTNDCKPNAFILFLEFNRSYVRTIASQIFIFISGVQSFVRTNDCKSNFHFYFWSAIVRTYERLQAKFFYFISGVQSFVRTNDCKSNFYFYFRSAIVRTYERLQAKFYFISGVQSFARTNDCKPCHILFLA